MLSLPVSHALTEKKGNLDGEIGKIGRCLRPVPDHEPVAVYLWRLCAKRPAEHCEQGRTDYDSE